MRAIAIGWRARAALERTAGRVTVQVPLAESAYAMAGEVIVWLGAPAAVLHGRAIVCDEVPGVVAGDALVVDGAAATTWQPPAPPSTARESATMMEQARELRARAALLGAPGGLAALWTTSALPFPLARAGSDAQALARACAAGEASAAAHAAIALLGAGAGLTPSGDDYVGGAFFARALLTAARGPDAEWRAAVADLLAAASGRTHPISAALLADHVAGHGHAPLHELARGLADADDTRAVAAARRLVRLGHTSGWDIVAGFMAGLGVS